MMSGIIFDHFILGFDRPFDPKPGNPLLLGLTQRQHAGQKPDITQASAVLKQWQTPLKGKYGNNSGIINN